MGIEPSHDRPGLGFIPYNCRQVQRERVAVLVEPVFAPGGFAKSSRRRMAVSARYVIRGSLPLVIEAGLTELAVGTVRVITVPPCAAKSPDIKTPFLYIGSQ